jgi:putative Mn2+ efflux pump MntP
VRHSLGVLISTAIGTSIEAMALGVTLALMGTNIIVAALSIGATTFALATLGIMVGRLIGTKFGRTAEACGWIVLMIGAKIGDPLRYCCDVDWVMAHAALADVAVR